MTLGENRVRLTFNPSSSELVDRIKRATAALIDLCDEHADDREPEAKRLWVLA
jgi:hypothetical protein